MRDAKRMQVNKGTGNLLSKLDDTLRRESHLADYLSNSVASLHAHEDLKT